MSIDLTTLSTREVLSAVYIGYYNRAADPAGIQFWEQVIANTSLDLVAVATDFSGQAETLAAHPFFADPATSSPDSFITSLYLNLFNRDPDTAGLNFWSAQLQNAIDGTGTFSVGEIIVKIIEGAVDVDGGTQDRTTILNKIEVAQDWTDAAEDAGGEFDAAAMASAKSIIAGVTDDAATVVSAKETTDAFFEPAPVPGDTLSLTSNTDVLTGTENDDQFNAYIQQNPFAGGVSNSLSSADRLEGGAGNDRLYAEVTGEFVGVVGNVSNIDIQPRLSGIEEIDIEARESTFLTTEFLTGGPVVVDAKNITDHIEIGSYRSDGDLKIENLTTLRSDGSARNTDAITVTMDHTDNFNSDDDPSDLTVLFDNDYLLAGEASEFTIQLRIVNTLELARNDDPLNSFKSITFTVGDTEVMVNIEGLATYSEVRDAINAELDAQGITGVTADLDLARTAIFTDDIEEFDQGDLAGSYLPVNIVSTNQPLETGPIELISDIEDFNGLNTWVDGGQIDTQDPISVNIELHKAGRGGEGGDLVIGGKADNVNEGIAGGIEVFNIDVLGIGGDGALAKPSNVGSITSTLGALRVVDIDTAPEFRNGDSFASLVVRNGFGDDSDDNLEEINADGFLGNLTLGSGDSRDGDGTIDDVDTVSAMGGGNITINADINEANTAFDYDTGAGDDEVNIDLNGDSVDYAGSLLDVSTGAGDDEVNLQLEFDTAGDGADLANNQLNQSILDNIDIDTGADDDTITVEGVGNVNIEAGSGNDTVYTDGAAQTVTAVVETTTITNGGTPITSTNFVTTNAQNAIWALNVDAERADVQGLGNRAPEDLPGEQLSLAYIGGATVTVTLSGAGIDGDFGAGGGVMANGADGATSGVDGFESSIVIDDLINGNDHFGTQADINAAILEAINKDAVLSKLLVASIGANNTLVVKSLTSGDFEDVDLRVDIEQLVQEDADDWDDVEAEAQQIFQDSGITIANLADANGNTPAADLTGSAEADEWYDGLSVLGDEENSMSADVDGDELSNLHTAGTASVSETDNVIDGGAGDDVIVLSTDAIAAADPAFTVSSNNALIGGSSNETIKLTGSSIGDDTIMNFRDGDVTELGTFDVVSFNIADDAVVDPTNGGAQTANETVVIINGVTESGNPLEVQLTPTTLPSTGDSVSIASQIAMAINASTDANVTASVTDDDSGAGILDNLVFVADDPGTTLAVTFTIEDRQDGTLVASPPAAAFDEEGAGTVVDEVSVTVNASGIDFLDFTAYLTSETDVSTGTPDSSDSDQLIGVTLNSNPASDDPTTEIQANEVTVITYTDNTGAGNNGTFENLSGADIAALFDGDDFDGGALSAADFDVVDNQDNDEVVGGVGKSIMMVENAANEGEYKVFELTWDASEDDGDEGVSANLLGSMDFGYSLTDLEEINLVGSSDHADLLANGFTFA